MQEVSILSTIMLGPIFTCFFFQAAAPEGVGIELGKSYTLKSEILSQTRRINVFFPPAYREGDSRYPVLFLLDGGVKEDFIHIAGIASLAAEFRKIRPFLVVGIEGVDRYHDLIHPSEVAEDRERLPTSGGSKAFRSFLEKELIPHVKKQFRTTEETVIMGESAAGMFVLETLLRQPNLFQGYIAVSPMLWWDNQSLAKGAPQWLSKKPFPEDRRLYLTIGDEGGPMQGGVDLLVEALKAHGSDGLKWHYAPMPQESHGTIFHPAALAALRKFFATKGP